MVVVLSYVKEVLVVLDDLELWRILRNCFNLHLANNMVKEYNAYDTPGQTLLRMVEMTPKKADWVAKMKMNQYMTYIITYIRRLVEILTKKYGVEDPTNLVAEHACPAAEPPLIADSPMMQSAVLLLAQ